MKKLFLASSVAMLLVSTAQAAPTVYGKAFVTANYVNASFEREAMDDSSISINEDNSSVEIASKSSRIGFKGSEAMTANTDVIYQLEYGIKVDDSGSSNIGFKSRDTYLGLKNKDFGEFRFGRNYSVVDYIDNVTVNEGYWDNVGASSLSKNTLANALTLTDGYRVNNSIVWKAPKYNELPLELALQYGADEDFISDDNSRDSGYGASLLFNPGNGFTAGVAYQSDLATKNPSSTNTGGDIIRGTATVDLSNYVAYPVKVGALYQQADFDDTNETEKGLILSAEMGLSNLARPASIYAQYNKTDNLRGINENNSDQIVVGGKYSFRKNIIAHAYVGNNTADLKNDLFIAGQDDGDKDILVRARGDASVFVVGAGLEYKF